MELSTAEIKYSFRAECKQLNDNRILVCPLMDLRIRLLAASECGDSGTVRKLLKHQVSPDSSDDSGDSALAKAARGSRLASLKIS